MAISRDPGLHRVRRTQFAEGANIIVDQLGQFWSCADFRSLSDDETAFSFWLTGWACLVGESVGVNRVFFLAATGLGENKAGRFCLFGVDVPSFALESSSVVMNDLDLYGPGFNSPSDSCSDS